MTEVITTKTASAICSKCGAAIYYVALWSGKRVATDKKRITIIHKVKEDVWTNTSGYLPHENTCPKGDPFNENNVG